MQQTLYRALYTEHTPCLKKMFTGDIDWYGTAPHSSFFLDFCLLDLVRFGSGINGMWKCMFLGKGLLLLVMRLEVGLDGGLGEKEGLTGEFGLEGAEERFVMGEETEPVGDTGLEGGEEDDFNKGQDRDVERMGLSGG